MVAVVVVIFVLGMIFLFLSLPKREKKGNWVLFFTNGKEAGFSIREMELIRKLAISSEVEDPPSIFKSQKKLETVIKYLIRSMRMSRGNNEPGMQDFLSKLFDYYKKIEMERKDNQYSISSTRQMKEGQQLRVLLPGTGVFKSEVVKNTGQTLTISRPVNKKVNSSLHWQGLKISVYFWREDDAGYVFDTEVIDEIFSKGISSLKIEQNDSLFRTQKRKSMRIKINKPAFLYLAARNDIAGKLEKLPGLNCTLDDISESGCAFMVKGQATSGLRLKVQFALDNMPICMLGTVRSVEYNPETGVSLVRMEADTLPFDMRNQILCEVFQMLPEDDEEELPFREIEEVSDEVSVAGQMTEAAATFTENTEEVV